MLLSLYELIKTSQIRCTGKIDNECEVGQCVWGSVASPLWSVVKPFHMWSGGFSFIACQRLNDVYIQPLMSHSTINVFFFTFILFEYLLNTFFHCAHMYVLQNNVLSNYVVMQFIVWISYYQLVSTGTVLTIYEGQNIQYSSS